MLLVVLKSPNAAEGHSTYVDWISMKSLYSVHDLSVITLEKVLSILVGLAEKKAERARKAVIAYEKGIHESISYFDKAHPIYLSKKVMGKGFVRTLYS